MGRVYVEPVSDATSCSSCSAASDDPRLGAASRRILGDVVRPHQEHLGVDAAVAADLVRPEGASVPGTVTT